MCLTEITCDIFVCVVGVWQCDFFGPVVCVPGATSHTRHTHRRSKFHAAKHRLRTQNITSNLSEARLILPEDGSQRIRNMLEFLIVF